MRRYIIQVAILATIIVAIVGCAKSVALEGTYRDYSGKVELVFTSEDKATLLIDRKDIIILEKKNRFK